MNVGKTLVRAAHGLPAVDELSRASCNATAATRGAHADLRRAVPRHGLRPADLPREPARHRDLPVGQCQPSSTTWAFARRSGARRWPMPTKRATGASSRLRPAADRARQTLYADEPLGAAIWTTPSTRSTRPPSICACQSVPLGAVSLDQGGRQAAHAAGSARHHSRVHPHHRRQAARRERARPAGLPKPGAFYVMDRGYVDFARLYALHQAGAFFVTRAKSNMDARRVYSATADRTHRRHLRSDRHAQRASTRPSTTPSTCGASASRIPSRARRWCS